MIIKIICAVLTAVALYYWSSKGHVVMGKYTELNSTATGVLFVVGFLVIGLFLWVAPQVFQWIADEIEIRKGL